MANSSRKFSLAGSWVALVTPFDTTGRIDFAAIDRLVEFHLDAGTDGIVISGTTGESPTLSDDEKCQVMEHVAKLAAGKIGLAFGSGANDTHHAVKLTRRAAELGADAVLVVTPYYNKPGQPGLIAHFTEVAAATKLPVILYNVPGRTGVNLSPASVLELAKIRNVRAVKEASGNLVQIQEILRGAPSGFVLLSGDDALNLPIMAVGGVGTISVTANVAPRRVKTFCDAARAQRWDEARREHLELLPLHNALFVEANPIPVKAALALLGLIGEHLRLPLVRAQSATRDTLSRVLGELGLLPDVG